MGAISSIEWTDRTWNPVRGCSIVSPGCVNCYAMKQAHRFSGEGRAYHGLTKLTKAGPQWTGRIRCVDDALEEPLHWRKPARVFVNSMSDLFHEDVPDAFIDRVFAVMALCPQHTFQVLTKRPERMRHWFDEGSNGCSRLAHVAKAGYELGKRDNVWNWPLPNVWLGVSVENQHFADERIPLLLQTPAAVRFISAEPLLGPVLLDNGSNSWLSCTSKLTEEAYEAMTDDEQCNHCCCESWDMHGDHFHGIDWAIVGGESGPGSRRFDIRWARSIVAQCINAGVPVFVKQLGAHPIETDGFHDGTEACCRIDLRDKKGGDPSEWPEDLRVREFPEGPNA